MKACAVRLLLIAGLLLLGRGIAPAAPAYSLTNIDLALRFYEEVSRVQASQMGAAGFAQIIRDRLTCYDQSTSPLERFRVCGIPYVDEIIRNARRNVRSKPELGLFIRNVQFCPVIHSMCTGEHKEPEQCILMERQCIDAALDKYWRGAASPLPRD